MSSCDGWVLIISIISRGDKEMRKNTQQLSFVFQMRVCDSAGAAGRECLSGVGRYYTPGKKTQHISLPKWFDRLNKSCCASTRSCSVALRGKWAWLGDEGRKHRHASSVLMINEWPWRLLHSNAFKGIHITATTWALITRPARRCLQNKTGPH